ncbi:MAG: 3-deoxy-D-manno-octulosonic acid transferase [Planctomycetota bacterium]|jgi:3-deoxy-D-manno-octulosonic-acid transferase
MLLDLVYLVAMLAASPVIAWLLFTKPRVRAGVRERLGIRLPRREGERPVIWVHGVSVGEVIAAKPLVQEIQRRLPGFDIAISTTTGTGIEVARKRFPDQLCFFYPLDLSFAVRRVVRAIRPSLIVLIELEIWPNFLRAAAKQGTPVVIANGRISEKSLRGYRRVQWLLRRPLSRIARFCVQTDTYADRFRALGVGDERLVVTGSVKYDALPVAPPGPEAADAMRAALGIEGGVPVIVGASTHPGEEALLLQSYRALRDDFPGLRLIVVPRHNERAPGLKEEIEADSQPCVLKTELDRAGPSGKTLETGKVALPPVVIGDTMGDLVAIYQVADVVFVGGSLVPSGGQNMLEPCGFGKAVMFGPHTHNFRASVEQLTEADAVRVTPDGDALTRELRALLADRSAREALGTRARAVVEKQRGASERTVTVLAEVLKQAGLPTSGPDSGQNARDIEGA